MARVEPHFRDAHGSWWIVLSEDWETRNLLDQLGSGQQVPRQPVPGWAVLGAVDLAA